MSQAICGVCRMRIVEFQHFRMRCQEVQGILKSTIKRNDDRSLQSEMQSSVAKLECPSESALATNEDVEKDAGVGPVGIHDIIVLEAVKIEPLDDCEETSEILLNKKVIESNYNDENQAFEPNSERTLSAFAQSAQTKNDSDNTTSHRCSLCHKVYQTEQKLGFHLKSAHGSKDHKCPICGVRFPRLKNLRKHQCTEKHLNSLKSTCSKTYTLREKIQKRSKTDHTELQTTDCVSKSDRTKESKLHKTQAHKDSPELEKKTSAKNDTDQRSTITSSDYTCTTCDRSFQRKDQLKNHLRSHQEYVVEDLSIDMEAIRLSLLSRLSIQLPGLDGIAQTAEETVHQCKICWKQLKSHQRLNSHMKNHQPKQHMCKHCGFSCSRRYSLQ
ncbi:zinc finger protein 484 [Aedes albopictus]|uniref:C2H2-type domain-containing protein n=1 Tax=Aedes albopictus TaxID=7160 RepID=A0ABM1Z821_AEDAL